MLPQTDRGMGKTSCVQTLAISGDSAWFMSSAGCSLQGLPTTVAGTPATVVNRFNQEINAALKSPEVIERLRRAYAFPEGGSPEEFTKFLADEGTRWAKLVKDANIKLD